VLRLSITITHSRLLCGMDQVDVCLRRKAVQLGYIKGKLV